MMRNISNGAGSGQMPATQKFAAFDGVGGLAWRESKSYGRSSIRGNQMNLGGPSATGFPDGLRTVFLKAPVPSGCTLTMVESSFTASILRRSLDLLPLQWLFKDAIQYARS